jgi:putative transposase
MTQNETVLGVASASTKSPSPAQHVFSAQASSTTHATNSRTLVAIFKSVARSQHTAQKVSGREDEHVKHVLHSVANRIVREALEHKCDDIIFEKLNRIRDRFP